MSAQHILVVELTAALFTLHSCKLLVHLIHVETQGVLVLELLVTLFADCLLLLRAVYSPHVLAQSTRTLELGLALITAAGLRSGHYLHIHQSARWTGLV